MNELQTLFGTTDITAILAKKKSETEKHDRAMSGKKPEKVKISVAECKKLCTQAGIEYLDGYEERVLQYRITDETVDRYGDVVVAKGGDCENYKKNPVVNHAHENSFPVANSIKLWCEPKEKAWYAWALFMDDRTDKSGRSDLVFRMASNGFMPACSIGFLPKETYFPTPEERAEMNMPQYGAVYKKWELLEFSTCSVQANPSALQASVKSKTFTDRDFGIMKEFKLFSDELLQQIETMRTAPETQPAAPESGSSTPQTVSLVFNAEEKETINNIKQLLEGNQKGIETISTSIAEALKNFEASFKQTESNVQKFYELTLAALEAMAKKAPEKSGEPDEFTASSDVAKGLIERMRKISESVNSK